MGSNASQDGGVPLGEALVEVVKQLKDQPLLLFGLGAGIILLGAGALALENLRVVAVVLLVVFVVSLVAWLIVEAQKYRRGQDEHTYRLASQPKFKGGDVNVQLEHLTDTEVSGGKARVTGSGSAQGGNVNISAARGIQGGKISGGDTEAGPSLD